MLSQTTTNSSAKLYLGIDVHKKSWVVYPATDLFDGKPFTTVPDAYSLIQWADKNYPKHEVICTYEACFVGFEPARIFKESNWQVVIVNPADIPRTSKHTHQKTDKIDSRNLCHHLRNGSLKPISIPEIEREQLRSLFRRRDILVRNMRKIKSNIKSYLMYYNIALPEEYDNNVWSKKMLSWIDKLQWQFETANLAFKSLIKQYKFVYSEILELSNILRAYCRKNYKNDYYLLQSVPGIGPLTAVAILAEVGDLRTFNFTQLASYIGLVPGIQQSGETIITTGVTPRSKSILRSYLIEASWQAVRFDTEMQNYYRKHFGKKPNKIIVKVAHKLLSKIHAVIKTQTKYQLNFLEPK